MIYVGIDCGEHTGLAVWDSTRKTFLRVETTQLHLALATVLEYHKASTVEEPLAIVFEDARKRKWFPREKNDSKYRGRLMGAGSVKRDSKIWEEFCDYYGIPYQAVAPRKGMTKWDPDYFATVTGWKGRTSEHARDAALLVFQR